MNGKLASLTKLPLMAAIVSVSLGTSAFADGIMDKIKSTGTLSVGTETAFEPFEFKKGGKIVGYGKDILDEVVASMDGVELNQLDLPWQGILPGLLAGKFDLVATSLTITEERAKKYALTAPVASYQTAMLKRAGNDELNSLADLNGLAVGTEQASLWVTQLEEIDADLKANGGEDIEIKQFKSVTDMFVSIANGTVDAGTYTTTAMPTLEKKRPGVFEVFDTYGDNAYFAWVVRPEDVALRDYISEQILLMQESGKLAELQEKWFGFTMEIPTEGYIPAGGF